MASKHRPSATKFVVCGKPPQQRRSQLERVGKLVMEGGETLVVVLGEEAGDPKAGWDRVRKAAGKACLVAPVMVSEGGEALYPTGTVQVRFKHTPSDEELEQFARSHRLRLRARNTYQPRQASFEITEPDKTYLPDLSEELDTSPDVHRAWPETKARYTRHG